MSSPTPPVVFYGFGFLHHGPRAAFHGLAARLDQERVIDITPGFMRRLPAPWRAPVLWRWLRYNEVRLRTLYGKKTRRRIHYFFPENTMFRAADWKGPHTLSATCHQPIDAFRQREGEPFYRDLLRSLRACDAVVVQCSADVEGYRAFLRGPRVEVIPLGVDASFFQPGDLAPGARPDRILTVGNWLRDYPTWADAVRRVHAQRPGAEFTVIANPDTLARARAALGACPAPVRWLTGISDQALREEYQRTRLLYLPLENAMANDALLEALASGLPIVATDLPATRDYVPDGAGLWVSKGDGEAGAAAILHLLDDPATATAMGRSARGHALAFLDWPVIVQQYRALWRSLA